jgi:large subunit ribosomal protein L17
MRHRVVRKKLGSDGEHQKSMLNNLSTSLIMHEKVETTLAKAKLLRPHIERLITVAGKATVSKNKLKKFNAVKQLNTKVNSSDAIRKLLEDIATRFANTPGGYTRVIKTGFRDGDQAEMARIEFTKTATKKESKTGKALKRAKSTTETKEIESEKPNE